MEKRILKMGYAKFVIIGICMLMGMQEAYAQQEITNEEKIKQELINISKQKWQWMADRNLDSLNVLFHTEAVFVHMGGTMNKEQELNTIKSGGIHYKHAEIKETSVRFVGNTAIILDRIRLTAIVGGNEVVNQFIVTEVYVPIDGKWKLGSLSFTKLLGE